MNLTTDLNYHGEEKTQTFFEGWYLKHQANGRVYAFIPGISIEDKGIKKPFIQIITETQSYVLHFQEDEFYADTKTFDVWVGNNHFSEKGMTLSIEAPEQQLSIHGSVSYGPFSSIKKTSYSPSIMGPFSYVGFLECYHGILSMRHSLSGSLQWNGTHLSFGDGTGYIEKDWGTSFPKAYIWTQCHLFESQEAEFFLSIADIPFLGTEFLGLISVLSFGGKEYRFATYTRARVTAIRRESPNLFIFLEQGKLQLEIEILGEEGKKLLAPANGKMNRIIRENASTSILVTLKENERVLFQSKGQLAGFEEVATVRGFQY